MKFLIVSLLILAVAYTENSTEWEQYKLEHSKNYNKEEDKHRKDILMKNKRKVEEYNAKYKKGEISYKVNLNQFSDMEPEEVSAKINGFRNGLTPPGAEDRIKVWTPPKDSLLPVSRDWRLDGAVTSVKNQGSCGCSWAFSAAGSLEALHFKMTGKLVDLSPQNLIDCVWTNYGCCGGSINNALDYVMGNFGIDTDAYYPYTTHQGTCRFNREFIGATCNTVFSLTPKDEKNLLVVVGGIAPVSAAIDGSKWSFIHYSGGIYDDPSCSSTEVNHAVLIVGYGREDDQDYWLVKNSWGVKWGENGYIKMSRFKNNQCGIASNASIPLYRT